MLLALPHRRHRQTASPGACRMRARTHACLLVLRVRGGEQAAPSPRARGRARLRWGSRGAMRRDDCKVAVPVCEGLRIQDLVGRSGDEPVPVDERQGAYGRGERCHLRGGDDDVDSARTGWRSARGGRGRDGVA